MNLFAHIGFTGTRQGMSQKQKRKLSKLLANIPEEIIFHHGDCIGADAEAHKIAKRLGYTIAIHPPINSLYRAFCSADILYWAKPYLERNKEIVDMCSLLIVCPKENTEVLRLGTWSTKRYAQKRDKELIIIKP
jgi:hypothetical protein